jgi:hypothetical protein
MEKKQIIEILKSHSDEGNSKWGFVDEWDKVAEEIIKALTGEPIPDVKTFTSTDYHKVVINSEADLPTKEGRYFGCRSGIETVFEFKLGLPDESWMREVRWYLQPVEQDTPKSGVEILRDEFSYSQIIRTITDSRFTGMNGINLYDVRSGARIMYDAMYFKIIKYLSQFPAKGVSDNEIHRQATDYAYERGGMEWYDALYAAFDKGAKYVRGKITKQ